MCGAQQFLFFARLFYFINTVSCSEVKNRVNWCQLKLEWTASGEGLLARVNSPIKAEQRKASEPPENIDRGCDEKNVHSLKGITKNPGKRN